MHEVELADAGGVAGLLDLAVVRNGRSAQLLSKAFASRCAPHSVVRVAHDHHHVLRALAALLSSSSVAINGQNIVVDDGWTL